MTVTVTPFSPAIGAEIHGLDLSKPISGDDFEKVRGAFFKHSVIVVRGSEFSDDDHIRFSAGFGELKKLKFNAFMGERRPEIFIVSNVKEDGKYIGVHDAGIFWHSDGPFLKHPHGPAALHALEVPVQDGRALGDTLFTSTAAAYDALPESTKKRLEGLQAVHSLKRRYEKAVEQGVKDSASMNQAASQETEAVHPLVRIHPTNGRPCLYVSEGYTTRILGMPADESRELIDELCAHVVKPEFQYVHSWKVHDLVMWDNCSTQHKATFDYQLPQRRLMHRTTLVN